MNVFRRVVSIVLVFTLVFFYSNNFNTAFAEGNETPDIQGLSDVTIFENETTTLHFTVSDDATPAGELSLSASSDNHSLLGSLSQQNNNGNVSIPVAPNEYANGTANITVTVTDAEGASESQTILLTVTPVNYAPTARDINIISIEVSPQPPVEITFDADDPDGDSLTYTITGQSGIEGKGTLSEISGNTVIFYPEADWTGTAAFKYEASDDKFYSNEATVTVTINRVNIAPVSNNQSVSCLEGGSAEITLSASDPNGDELNYSIADDSGIEGKGTLSAISGNKVTFTPLEGWSGTASFTFMANDGELDSNISTVTITADPVNAAPASYDGAVSADEDVPEEITFMADDPDEQTLTYIIVDDSGLAGKGTLSAVSGNKVTFTPLGNWNGTASFTFKANDGELDSNISTITVTVDPVNDAPVSYGGSVSAGEDVPAEITLSADDAENDGLTYIIIDDSGLAGKGTLSALSGNKVTFTPSENWNGTASFTFKANDGELDSNISTITVTADPVNDAPVSYGGIASTDEDVPVEIALLADDAENDGLTYIIVDDSGLVGKGTLSAVSGNKVTFTPSENWNGTASFTFKANDGELDSNISTVTITADPVNDAPVSYGGIASTGEDVPVEVTLLAYDLEGEELTFGIVDDSGLAGKGTLSAISGNKVTFTPLENWNGTASFTFKANDGELDSNVSTITITADPANDAPVSYDGAAFTDEHVPIGITLTADDIEGDDLTFSFVDTLGLSGKASLSLDGNTATFTPLGHWNGTASFTFKANDSELDSNVSTITVTVYNINDAPEVEDDTAATDEDIPVTIDVLLNDSDTDLVTNPGEEQLSISVSSVPLHGTAEVVDGMIVYTPSAHWNGVDTFEYTVTDLGGLSSAASVTVTVVPVFDAPVAADDEAVTSEHVPVTIYVLDNDDDIDLFDVPPMDELSIYSVTQPAHGAAAVSEDKKTVMYTPSGHWNGIDTFTYVVIDKGGFTSAAAISVTVNPVNDPPAAAGDTASTNEDISILINVLANDTDVDFYDVPMTEHHTVISVSVPENGTAAIEDNKIRYTPALNRFGTDTFTYTMEDSGGLTSSADVAVTVISINDAPVISNVSGDFNIDEHGTAAITFDISDVETPTESLLLQYSSSNQTLLPDANITLTGTGSDDPQRTLTLKPAGHNYGSTDVTLRLSDGFLVTTQVITLTVNPVNDPPAANTDTLYFTEDVPLIIDMDDLVNNDTDVKGDDLWFLSYENDVSRGTMALTDESENKYLYTPPRYFDGAAAFHYIVTDGELTARGTVNLRAIPVNNVPAITMDEDYPAGADEDSTLTGLGFTIFDPETSADQLALTALCGDKELIEDGGITITRGANGYCTLTVTPNAHKNGTADITISVSDGVNIANETFAFTVNPVEYPAEAADDFYAMEKDSRLTIAPLQNDYDWDNDALTLVTINGSADEAVVTERATITRSADNTITYTPIPGFRGIDTFTYGIADECGLGCPPSVATVTITVGGENSPPELMPLADRIIMENELGENRFAFYDTDIGDSWTFSAVSSNQALLPGGNITIDPESKKIFFTPSEHANGETNITFTVTDSGGLSGSYTFKLTVLAVNYPPSLQSAYVDVDENSYIDIDLLEGATDLDGDSLRVVSVVGYANGTLTPLGDGVYRYAPYSYYSGSDSLTYTVTDGNSKVTSTGSITINEVNQAPIAVDDWCVSDGTAAITIDVLANDYDHDNRYDPGRDTLLVDAITLDPLHGTAAVSADKKTVVYTPDLPSPGTGDNVYDTFTYSITDSHGATDTAVVHVSRTDAGGGYTHVVFDISDEFFEDSEARTYDIRVFNPGCGKLTAAAGTAPSLGTVAYDEFAMTLTYTPNADAYGEEIFNFIVSDGTNEVQGTAHFTILPVNDAPEVTAVGDMTINENTETGTFRVTVSDPDTQASDLSLAAYSDNGALIPPGRIQITKVSHGIYDLNIRPPYQRFGTALIHLLASDRLLAAERTFILNVNEVNDPPVAYELTVTTNEEVPVTFAVGSDVADPDNPEVELTVEITENPAYGTAAVGTDGRIIYKPEKDFVGADTVEYRIYDGNSYSEIRYAVINVINVNDAPVISDISYVQSVLEDTQKQISFSVYDAEDDTIILTAVSSNSIIIPSGDISFDTAEGKGGARKITIDPALNKFGAVEIMIFAYDGTETTAYTFKLTVESVNDAPAAAGDSITTSEHIAININVLSNDTDIEDEPSVMRVVELRNPIAPSKGTVSINADGTVRYSPTGHNYGTDTFSYTISDSGGATAAATVTVTINPVNDAPTVVNHTRTIAESIPGALTSTGEINVLSGVGDVKGEKVTVTGYGTPSKGTIEILGPGLISYTPDMYANGTDTFSYRVTDDNASPLTSTGWITINITPVNAPPVLTPLSTLPFEFNEDTTGSFILRIFDPETVTSSLITTITSTDQSIIKDADIRFTGTGTDRTIRMTPLPNKFGSLKIRVQSSDGVNTTVDEYDIIVRSVNDAPVLGDTAVSINENTQANGKAIATDVETSLLLTYSLKAVTGPSHGTAHVNSDGTWTYTPAPYWNGTDSFVIAACDNDPGDPQLTDEGTVTVTVRPVNYAPSAANDAASTAEHSAITINALGNDIDPDIGDLPEGTEDITIISVTQPANGLVEIAPDGKLLTYTPNPDWDGVDISSHANHWNGTESFEYTIEDVSGLTSSATVTVTVNPVNGPPTAIGEHSSTLEHTGIDIDVLANDLDSDIGDTAPARPENLIIVSVTQPAHGHVDISPDGKSVHFQPNAGWDGTETMDPNNHYYGLDHFTYTINDKDGVPSTAVVTVDIAPVNDRPNIWGITGPITIDENGTTGALTFSIYDVEGSALTFTRASSNTTLLPLANITLGGSGGTRTVTLAPAPYRNGYSNVTLTVRDPGGLTRAMTFRLNVTPVNYAPTASNDSASTNEHVPVTISVLTNDTDPDSVDTSPAERIVVDSVTQPSHGTVVCNSAGGYYTTITYTPAGHYYGPDSFTYTVIDTGGLTSAATVSITVNEVNDIPVAAPDAAETDEHVPVTIEVLGNDTDTKGETLSISGITQAPLHGSAEISGDMIIYTPNALGGHYYGTDTLRYEASDGRGGLATAVVTVTITEVNDLPVAAGDSTETDEHVPVTINVLANDTDTKGETVTITGITQEPLNGTAEIIDQKVVYTPNASGGHWYGTETFKYSVSDGRGGTAEATVTVTVNEVNDIPVAAPDAAETDEHELVIINALANDSDAKGEELSVSNITQAPLHGSAEIAGGMIVYTPNASGGHYYGTDTFKYEASDGRGGTATAEVTVTVNEVNDPPVAMPDSAETEEHIPVTIEVLDNDSDPKGEELTITRVTQEPGHGTTEITASGILYTPADEGGHWNGTDTFKYEVSDGRGGYAEGLVTITVHPVNDAPDISEMTGMVMIDEDTDTGALSFSVSDVEDEPGSLKVDLFSTDMELTPEGSMVLGGTGGNRTLTITPATNRNGSATITLIVTDSGDLIDITMFMLNVMPVNDAPAANSDSESTSEHAAKVINVLANDADPDLFDSPPAPAEDLFVTEVTQPAHGSVTIAGDGKSVTYQPNSGWNGTDLIDPDNHYNGPDSFTYTISDREGVSSAAAVYITVTPVNDAPVAYDDAAITEEHEPVVIGVLGNDIDADLVTNPEYEDLTISSVTQPLHGSVTITADGKTLIYQPNPDWDGTDVTDAANHWNGTESFFYTVTDRDGASSSASAAVTVRPVNDAPLAVDDHVNTLEMEGPVTFNVLANDIDADLNDADSGEALTIISVTQPLHGTAVIKDNKIEYTSAGYYSGEDSFTYTIRDASGAESAGTVYVSVSDLNFPPPAPVFTQPYEASFYKSGQSVHVRWNESMDPDGDEVTYTLEFYDGAEWHNIAQGLTANVYDFTVPEGVNTIKAAFRAMATDAPGLSSEKALSAEFIIDNLAPAGTVLEMSAGSLGYAAGAWTNKAVTFTLSETTDIIAFETYIRITPEGEAPGEWMRTESIVLSATGKYTVEYYSVDALGNAAAADSREIYIDMIAPPVPLIAPVSKQNTNKNITLKLSTGEDVGGSGNAYMILPDGTKANVFPDMAYTVTKNGTYTFILYDAAGNSSTSSIIITTIDKQAPAVPDVNVSVSGAKAVISFTLKDDPGGSGNSYFILPDGSKVPASSGAVRSVSENGNYNFELYDKAGNRTTFTVSVTLIDVSAPEISCDAGGYTIGETSETAIIARLAFTDSESVITKKAYEASAGITAGGSYKKYSGDIVMSKPGTYYIHAYAENSFGLKTYRTFGPFIVAAPPEGRKGDVTIDTGDIPGGADKIRLPGGEWTDKLTLEDIRPGTYTIEVMDRDGNITSVNITITDEEIAAGSYNTKTPDYVWYILAAALMALIILLLILKPNVMVKVYAAGEGGNKKALKTIKRRKRKENEVTVTVKEGQALGGVYGTITLTRLFTKSMRGRTLKVMLGLTEVYSARVPQDAQGRFEGKIEAWRK